MGSEQMGEGTTQQFNLADHRCNKKASNRELFLIYLYPRVRHSKELRKSLQRYHLIVKGVYLSVAALVALFF